MAPALSSSLSFDWSLSSIEYLIIISIITSKIALSTYKVIATVLVITYRHANGVGNVARRAN